MCIMCHFLFYMSCSWFSYTYFLFLPVVSSRFQDTLNVPDYKYARGPMDLVEVFARLCVCPLLVWDLNLKQLQSQHKMLWILLSFLFPEHQLFSDSLWLSFFPFSASKRYLSYLLWYGSLLSCAWSSAAHCCLSSWIYSGRGWWVAWDLSGLHTLWRKRRQARVRNLGKVNLACRFLRS